MFVALRLLLREHQSGLRLLHLRLVGADLRLLDVDLRIDVLDVGLRRRDLRLAPARAPSRKSRSSMRAITSPASTCWLSVTGTAVM